MRVLVSFNAKENGDYTGWPNKNGTAYMYFPQYADAITGISG